MRAHLLICYKNKRPESGNFANFSAWNIIAQVTCVINTVATLMAISANPHLFKRVFRVIFRATCDAVCRRLGSRHQADHADSPHEVSWAASRSEWAVAISTHRSEIHFWYGRAVYDCAKTTRTSLPFFMAFRWIVWSQAVWTLKKRDKPLKGRDLERYNFVVIGRGCRSFNGRRIKTYGIRCTKNKPAILRTAAHLLQESNKIAHQEKLEINRMLWICQTRTWRKLGSGRHCPRISGKPEINHQIRRGWIPRQYGNYSHYRVRQDRWGKISPLTVPWPGFQQHLWAIPLFRI